MLSPFINAGIYLIKVLFGLYSLIVLLRILILSCKADYLNPISQFVFAATKPVLKWVERGIPRFFGIDTAGILLVIILEILKIVLLSLFSGTFPNIFGILIWSVGNIFNQLLNLYFFLILFRIIFSWLMPSYRTQIARLLHQLTEPVLRPARKIIPAISGFDVSPIVVIIIFQVMVILLVTPMIQIGMRLALS